MLFWTIVKVALKSLSANKLRSFLSMLGIIIGVAAVVSMLALGTGAQKKILDQVTAMGANLLIVRAGQPPRQGVRGGQSETLVVEDVEALLNEIPEIESATPVVQSNAQFKYYNENKQAPILGAAPTYFAIRNYEVERGRAFTDGECDRMAAVAVLGPTTAKDLFGDSDPLKEIVKIDGRNFTVIGVLKPKGDQGFFNPDEQAVIPYTTAMKQLMGVDYLREVDLQIARDADQEAVQTATEGIIRRRHRILDSANDDFHVRNMAEMVETATEVTETFTMLLAAVAAISLVVGGIGIMNIMFVTVTERTREIGIRKAIGAKDRDILIQFLLEAIIMSGLGGLIGVVLGISVAEGIGHVSTFAAIVQPSSVLLALSFSAGVGVFFGFYPARRAALLDPIDALSYE
ncbi:MAG TPA: ABC transporter permease [Candidatus Hydrogenedentes bacterium]|nr:ABC transporter permease [Candidatus Hydrogenedentota bacterium]HPG69194.1 ABC transporter permease [Candidatus Hydrogenedentota bacterium]